MITTIKNNTTYLYGTIDECAEEIFRRIEISTMTFPDFDFATGIDWDLTQEDFDKVNDINDLGWFLWYGCKDLGYVFDAATISAIFGCYGGGGVASCRIAEYDVTDPNMENFIDTWVKSISDDIPTANSEMIVLVELLNK